MRRWIAWCIAVAIIASALAILKSRIHDYRQAESYATQEERAGLNRTITSVDLGDRGLSDDIDKLGRLTGARIILDDYPHTMTLGESRRRSPGELLLDAHLGRTRLSTALDLLIAAYSTLRPFNYECRPDGTIHLSARPGKNIVRSYDVRDLLEGLRKAASPEDANFAPENVLLAVIQEADDPISYALRSSNRKCVGGHLIVIGPQPEQEAIERTLAQLRHPLTSGPTPNAGSAGEEETRLALLETLDRPMPPSKFAIVPLSQAVRLLGERSGINVIPWGLRRRDEVEPMVWIGLPGSSLVSNLRVLARRPITFAIDRDMVLVISIQMPLAPAMREARIWDVEDILKRSEDFQRAHGYSERPSENVITLDVSSRPIDAIAQLTEQVTGGHYRGYGGTSGWIHPIGAMLITVNTAYASRQIATMLQRLRAVQSVSEPNHAPPTCLVESDSLFERLRMPIPTVRFDNVPLEQAILVLSEQAGLPIAIDQSLENVRIRRDEPVSMHLSNVPLHKVLDELLGQQAIRPAMAGYSIEQGVILLGDSKVLNPLVCVYDVRDLIDPANQRHLRGIVSNGVRDGDGATADLLLQKLIPIIQATVDPDGWEDNGGTAGAIRKFGGLLIVTQTPENQLKIESFLDALRGGKDWIEVVK